MLRIRMLKQKTLQSKKCKMVRKLCQDGKRTTAYTVSDEH